MLAECGGQGGLSRADQARDANEEILECLGHVLPRARRSGRRAVAEYYARAPETGAISAGTRARSVGKGVRPASKGMIGQQSRGEP